MANSGPNTNGVRSQFFVCTYHSPWLYGKHVVFAKVSKGMRIVQEIESAGTATGAPKKKLLITNCGEL